MSVRALVLRAAGSNCDHETALALERAGAVAERFPVSPAGVSWQPAPPWPVTVAPAEPVTIEVGGEQSRLYLGRIAEVEDTDRAALRVLAAVLSDRLARTVREQLGLAYSLGASVRFSTSPGRAWMTVRVGTRPDNLETALKDGDTLSIVPAIAGGR